jgi:hypothetical protein
MTSASLLASRWQKTRGRRRSLSANAEEVVERTIGKLFDVHLRVARHGVSKEQLHREDMQNQFPYASGDVQWKI